MPVKLPKFPEAALGQELQAGLTPSPAPRGGKPCPGCRVGEGVCQPQPLQPACPWHVGSPSEPRENIDSVLSKQGNQLKQLCFHREPFESTVV